VFIKLQRKWIFVCLGLFVLFLSSAGFRSYWSKRRYYKKLEISLEETRKINKELETEIERIKKDPTLYGDYARRELGLAPPEEMEYRFVLQNSTTDTK